ncbi:MAG: DUF4268 domain-containing protein [Chitinophagaceae bacterium]|nr:DUF4268 domain-containing protein [Chitinophagaceae bacterium]
MFLIEKQTNTISPLLKKTFTELGFQERKHLQEWIAKNPDCLGEKLLIIQKEFNDFSETNERLDLLALDKNGNLVIIENKLDDSGRDVTWQALKYASYCSTLTKEEVRKIFQSYLDQQSNGKNAQELITEFYNDIDYSDIVINQQATQRIILVAANFRKEVTSTVLWLLNFKIQLQCMKVTPYQLGELNFLNIEQIIPTKDAQDYIISMTNKVQEEINIEEEARHRYKIRLTFWSKFLNSIKNKSALFQNSNPTKDNALYAGGTGITYVSFQVIITGTQACVALNFGRSLAIENKILFDALLKHKDIIDNSFGDGLVWERHDNLKKSVVAVYKTGLNYFNEEEWTDIINFLIENLNKLYTAVKPYFNEISSVLISSTNDVIEPIEDLG